MTCECGPYVVLPAAHRCMRCRRDVPRSRLRAWAKEYAAHLPPERRVPAVAVRYNMTHGEVKTIVEET
jgi:hypothetical protein